MEDQKKYWCFSCNKPCQIIKAIEDGDEVYQCSFCKNSFVEEMETNNNQTQNQTQIQSQNSQQNIGQININITNTTNIQNNQRNIQNQNQDQYGMDNTLLFLPSTVKVCLIL